MKKKSILFAFFVVILFNLSGCFFNNDSVKITPSNTDSVVSSSAPTTGSSSEIPVSQIAPVTSEYTDSSKVNSVSSSSNSKTGNHNNSSQPSNTYSYNSSVSSTVSSSVDPLNELRNKIENTYKVEILYGSETFFNYNTDFKQLMDPNYIKIGLNNLNTELARYPKGLFSELARTLRIFLITGFSDLYSGMATYENPGYFDLYLSTSPQSVETLHHEIMHMIDFTMEQKSGYSGFDKWESFNPDEFQYTGLDYTLSNLVYDNVRNIKYCFFVSDYSLKSPYEDRAEIFAMLMMDDVSVYISSENPIRDKIIYLNSEIRRVFKSVKATKLTEWEKNIK